jgi:hypothetical protein
MLGGTTIKMQLYNSEKLIIVSRMIPSFYFMPVTSERDDSHEIAFSVIQQYMDMY